MDSNTKNKIEKYGLQLEELVAIFNELVEDENYDEACGYIDDIIDLSSKLDNLLWNN